MGTTVGLVVMAGACVAGIVWGTKELYVMGKEEKMDAVRTANRRKVAGMMADGETTIRYTTPRGPAGGPAIFRPAKPRKGGRAW